ncbi:MAG: hypothetical protein V4632_05180 [Pseudomonadota bacterium]
MVRIFVLDVPEFLPLVAAARNQAGVSVLGPQHDYYRIESETELRFGRRALGFKPAVWHGALTGGFRGRIAHFDNDELLIVSETGAAQSGVSS